MAKVLYIDAIAGAAGDMLAGALVDLGWPLDELRGLVQRMELPEVELEAASASPHGIQAQRLVVKTHEHHPHRHLSHILEMLEKLPPEIGQKAAAVFTRLAQAEAKVHGTTPEEVHFHEVGAVDAIVDIVAFCAGITWLGAERIIASPLPLGRGFVDCAHGRIPLPAPAVVNLLADAPTREWPEQGETVTPTGAALITTLAHGFGPLPAMVIKGSGFGCGTRQGEYAPNVVRLILGEETGGRHCHEHEVVEIVCNLDDVIPEDLPLVIERLMAAGALDAGLTPLIMKKGRPAFALTVMADPQKADELADLVLGLTPSLGVRMRAWRRRCLHREMLEVQTPWGPVRVKKAARPGGVSHKPEAEDVHRICTEHGLSPAQVRAEISKKLG